MTKEETINPDDTAQDINDIYELMLRQSSSTNIALKQKIKKLSYMEKVLEIKGFLNL
jgi:cell division protein FtsL